MGALIDLAEDVLRTRQPRWSPFLSALMLEDANQLESLAELKISRDGGYPGAERKRLLIQHATSLEPEPSCPVAGLNVEGNFLFDPTSPDEMRLALQRIGIDDESLGDLWIRGDRGAQAICTPEAAALLQGQRGSLREVIIACESLPLEALQWPVQRVARRLSSVEASCRLDAIASAGFGISRSKVVKQIKEGRLRLNWEPVRLASRDLKVGDSLQLQERGSIEVLNIERTKRERWRVDILRQ
jgi:photosystem II S4 domain protein